MNGNTAIFSNRKVLLIVTATFLLGSVIFALHHTQANTPSIATRNATRINDLTQIQNDLQLYYNKCGYYPGTSQPGSSCSAYAAIFTWADLTKALIGSNLGITNVPNDPTAGTHYFYGAGPGSKGYVLGATFEDPTNPALAQSVAGFAYGVRCTNRARRGPLRHRSYRLAHIPPHVPEYSRRDWSSAQGTAGTDAPCRHSNDNEHLRQGHGEEQTRSARQSRSSRIGFSGGLMLNAPLLPPSVFISLN